MRLTSARLAPYLGGQIQISNQRDRKVEIGESKTLTVEGGELKIEFAWRATGGRLTGWVSEETLQYTANLKGGTGRRCKKRFSLRLASQVILVFTQPDDPRNINSAQVKGLQLRIIQRKTQKRTE